MSISDAIAEALANASPDPPPNESTTCDWVILPLLHAVGYARRDVVSRVTDNSGQFPDYTILPNSPRTWYLEAKDWNSALEDKHAQQALNYEGNRYFLNHTPDHPSRPMTRSRKMAFNGTEVYMDSNSSARDYIFQLNALCAVQDVSVGSFLLEISPAPSAAKTGE